MAQSLCCLIESFRDSSFNYLLVTELTTNLDTGLFVACLHQRLGRILKTKFLKIEGPMNKQKPMSKWEQSQQKLYLPVDVFRDSALETRYFGVYP